MYSQEENEEKKYSKVIEQRVISGLLKSLDRHVKSGLRLLDQMETEKDKLNHFTEKVKAAVAQNFVDIQAVTDSIKHYHFNQVRKEDRKGKRE